MNSLLRDLNKQDLGKSAFADYLSMVIGDDSLDKLQTKIDRSIESVNDWCISSEVQLNVNKTEIVDFSKTRFSENLIRSIKLNGKDTVTAKKFKYLGMVIKNKLRWAHHFKHLHKKNQ